MPYKSYMLWLIWLVISYAILWFPQMLVNPFTFPLSLTQAGVALSRLVDGNSLSLGDWMSMARVAAVLVLFAIVVKLSRKQKEASQN